MRILFLTFQFPYPAMSGAAIKTLSLLDYLRRAHDICLVSLHGGSLSAEQSAWTEDLAGVATIEIDKPRNVWTLLRSYAAGVPLRIERNRTGEMGRVVKKQIADFKPEAMFADGLSMAQYIPGDYRGLRLLHEHNVEYLIWHRQAEIERGPRRWVAAREAVRLRRYEASAFDRFDMIFAVSEVDRSELIALGGDAGRVRLLPNIPEPGLLEMPAPIFNETEPVVLYFGTLSWQPNIEGLVRLLTSVFPEVRRSQAETRLVVAGAGASPGLAERVATTDGAEFTGEVIDPEVLYRRARVLVEATRSGGGTRLKVLNAMARGIPVVASPVAAEGLEVVSGEHLLIAGGDAEMAADIVRLLSDSELWRKLSENARTLVRSRYVADVAYRALDEALAPARAPAG